jgi:hypothetical protein
VNRQIDAPIDYDDCDHELFRAACSFCDCLPMPGDEPYKRCGQCKVPEKEKERFGCLSNCLLLRLISTAVPSVRKPLGRCTRPNAR